MNKKVLKTPLDYLNTISLTQTAFKFSCSINIKMNKQQPKDKLTTIKHYHNQTLKCILFIGYTPFQWTGVLNKKMGMSLGHESKSRASHKQFSVSLLNNKDVHFDSASADDFLFYLQAEL